MSEKILVWNPLPKLNSEYYLKSISSGMTDRFEMVFVDAFHKNSSISISLALPPDALRRRQASMVRDGKRFDSKKSFFKILNSDYVNGLADRSFGIHKAQDFVHYLIFTRDTAYEFISTVEPFVERVQSYEE